MKSAIENNKAAVEAITKIWMNTKTINGCRMVNEALQFAIKESSGLAPSNETDEIFAIRDLCMAKCHFMICEELNKEKTKIEKKYVFLTLGDNGRMPHSIIFSPMVERI